MNRRLKHIFILLILFGPFSLHGQDCYNYHINNCRWADRTFLYSRQSRSAVFTPGMRSEFQIVVYGGEEYYISVDGHRKLGDIQLRVYEDTNKETLLYDNAKYKYEEYFFFKNTRTRDLIVEITTEKPDDPENKKDKYCLGVLIEFRSVSKESGKDNVGF